MLAGLTDEAFFKSQLAEVDYNQTHEAVERAAEIYRTAVIIDLILKDTTIPSSIQERGHVALQATRFLMNEVQYRLSSEQ